MPAKPKPPGDLKPRTLTAEFFQQSGRPLQLEHRRQWRRGRRFYIENIRVRVGPSWARLTDLHAAFGFYAIELAIGTKETPIWIHALSSAAVAESLSTTTPMMVTAPASSAPYRANTRTITVRLKPIDPDARFVRQFRRKLSTKAEGGAGLAFKIEIQGGEGK